ncbi:hypothetical protein GIB67_020255 [Kingdonia uniflora]|uniref:PLAC8 motif-containing protein n=1 Tax=Kingdonia uniflora TaxID=39325 RepID=A0A7J7P426_9MAGN|nr:hypothetical protein GIB67_020255 [Kingdonia uniflora]
MAVIDSDNGSEGVQVELSSGGAANGCTKVNHKFPLHVSTSQKGLLGQNPKKGLLGIITTLPDRVGFLKLGEPGRSLASPSARLRQIAEQRDDFSRSVPSSTSRGSLRKRFSTKVREVNWDSMWKMCKKWIRNPMNMAVLLWGICVAISGAILFMVMIGMLNHAIPKKSQRNAWFEVNNQILNALFTLMCLYSHPKRFYHLVLLCKWRQEDVSRLRKIYCKNGTYKPNEWAHMMVVVVLLHINCFAQYALCGLNLGYRRAQRPPIGVGICISVAIGAPAIAGLYSFLSPLGRDYEPETDHEAQVTTIVDENRPLNLRVKSLQKRFSFASRDDQRVPENRPEWRGGLFDFWEDISVAYLSLFCSFCVFGWNMERLGFGNMYVHIATFLLFCTAPFWIFLLAAINIENETVREAMAVTGVVLCVFGFLYGGFWRIQMRKRFNLPANDFCCGYPAVTDCAQWLCCCWCSLSQEVRTGDFYDIVEDKLYLKGKNVRNQFAMSPLPREDGSMRTSQSSPPWNGSSPFKPEITKSSSPSRSSEEYNSSDKLSSKPEIMNSPSPSRFSGGYNSPNKHLVTVEEEAFISGENDVMTPPVPAFIHK